MLNTHAFTLLAGHPEPWDAEISNGCRPGRHEGTLNSQDLCSLQADQSARGRRSVQLIRSIYGWTLRYASGLQDFAILYSSKDHSPAKALVVGLEWVWRDPDKRELYVSKGEVERCERDGYDCSELKVFHPFSPEFISRRSH